MFLSGSPTSNPCSKQDMRETFDQSVVGMYSCHGAEEGDDGVVDKINQEGPHLTLPQPARRATVCTLSQGSSRPSR